MKAALLALMLALGILVAPLTAEAQQAGKIPRIGMLSFTTPGTEEENRRIEVFKQGLRERGYVQGQNIAIEPRHSAGRDELLPRLAAELVGLKVDVILTYGTKATRAAKQATGTIPIVMLTALDPVGAGLVANLARPGGNITGSSEVSEELSAKRLDLLKAAEPKAKRIAVLFDPSFSFITPDLCNDGHDGDGTPGSCADGGPGGLPAADAFLRTWVPLITGSPVFKHDGLLVITFDEAEGDPGSSTADASACCNEAQFPNTPNNGGPVPGMGGGKVGAVALSPFIRGGTVTSHPYNHFSLLRSFEALFGLPYLGYANTPNPGSFGTDVFTGTW